jgi:pimeloyl-ACP methyl ester carboxylesterase
VLIGHSIGGGIAMSVAADHPALIGRIVVVDALPYLAASMNLGAKADPDADCSPMVQQFTAMSDEQLYQVQQRVMPSMIADTSRIATAIKWTMDSDRATLGRIYCQFSNTDLREKIGRIACPSLILLEAPFRQQDQAMQRQYAALRNKSIHYSTKGLHFIMYDDKDWFFAELASFLQ